MDILETKNILAVYNKWRNGADVFKPSSDEITEAIENAIDYIEEHEKHNAR